MPAHTSKPIRRSIEVEYWVIDEEGRLVEPGELVDSSPGTEREFVEPLLEIKTTPCETSRELHEELCTRVREVLHRADELGKGLVPLGTPLHASEIRDIPHERTQIQDEVVGAEFEYVRHCAGTHIHVEQQPGCERDQLNAFIALDPALALVNSSPYYRGQRVATGARSKIYRRLAYEGVAHQGRLWPYITEREEWDRRLERRYEEFVTAALDAGVSRQVIEANFDAESAVWTPVKFRERFDTVEWRSPDTAVPSQVLALADQLVSIVDKLRTADVQIDGKTGHVTSETVTLPEFDAVLRYLDTAIESGLTDEVRSYLDRMGFDVAAYEPVSPRIDGTQEITRQEAQERRLEHAHRLEQDVDRPLSAASD